jgi:hypothetical protein
MIMITVISSYLDETRRLIEGLGIGGFTQISELKGAGRKGKRMDSAVFPGTSSILLTVVGDEQARQLMESLGGYSSSLPEKDALRAFQIQVEACI